MPNVPRWLADLLWLGLFGSALLFSEPSKFLVSGRHLEVNAPGIGVDRVHRGHPLLPCTANEIISIRSHAESPDSPDLNGPARGRPRAGPGVLRACCCQQGGGPRSDYRRNLELSQSREWIRPPLLFPAGTAEVADPLKWPPRDKWATCSLSFPVVTPAQPLVEKERKTHSI